MVPIARRNLFAEKPRLLISVAGVTFAVLLILVVETLYRGFEREAGSFIESVPGDIWVMEQDTTDIFHSFSLLSEERIANVAETPGADSVIPLYSRRATATHDGASSDTYFMAFGVPDGTEVLPGIPAPAPGEVVVDNVFARKMSLSPGDTLGVRGRDFTIAGIEKISNVGLSQFSLMSAADAREILAVPGNANYLLVSAEAGTDPAALVGAIQEQTPGVRAETKSVFADENRNEIVTFFLPIITVLVVIAFLVGTAVIGLTIYTATIERSREYGVLKAIGASGGYLYRVVIAQSIIVSVVGFLLGIPLTLAVNKLAVELVPEFVNILLLRDVIWVFAASMGMAVVAAIIPIRRVAGIDPAAVFRA